LAKRVFFSFHYERDAWRAAQVRNIWVTKPDREAVFRDAAGWEAVKRQGDDAIRRWIEDRLENTSVTVVLIGTETCNREWVRYEIQRSYEKGNRIVGIYIHTLRDQNGNTEPKGDIDFGKIGGKYDFDELARVYDWVEDNGYEKLGEWIERDYLIATRPQLEPPLVRYGKSCH
jgi:hypothetical protein